MKALTVLLIFLPAYLTSARPLILSAHEGDRVFIPCFSTRDTRIYIWKIKESVYPVEELPIDMYLERTLNGIFVHNTTMSISGDFTCYTFEERTHLREISTVQFFVQERDLPSETEYEEPEGHQRTELSLRVTESDTVFIPCIPALGTNNATIWGIDGSLYPFLELPFYHIHQQGGIIVHNISLQNYAGEIYRCYSTPNNIIQEQFTIQLKFYQRQSRDEMPTSGFLNSKELKLKLVSRGVSLKQDTTYEFLYRIVNATQVTTGFCIPGNLTSTMNISDGTESLWHNDSIALLPEFSPPRNTFEDRNAYANVYSTNISGHECARLDKKIKVKIDGNITFDDCTPEGNDVCCVQEGGQSCVQLPDDLTALNVIWPTTPQSDQDCVCAVFLPSPMLPDITFEDCYCFKNGLTPYNVTLNQINKRLCWENLTRDTNDTNILFVRDTDRSEINSNVRTFLSEAQITVEDLDPFPPRFIENKPATVCINSTNPAWSPVQKTLTTAHDNTGDLILDIIADSNDFCLSFEDFSQSCAPFKIEATAYTRCSRSSTATFNVTGINTESSTCECLKNKVNLTATASQAEANSITVSFSTTCLRPLRYYVDNITDLYIQTVETYCTENCTTRSTSFTIQCDQNFTYVTVNNLEEVTTYTLSVVWISPSNSSLVCKDLMNNIIQKTVMSEWEEWKKYLLGFGVTAAVGGVLIITVVGFYYLHKWWKKNRHSEEMPIIHPTAINK